MDDDIKKLVSVLVDEQSHCRAMSICGMGGLGKTTLAKRVYHHSQVRGHFDHLAWVYVSQQCQKRKVWEDMLSGLISSNERGSKLSDEELAEKLFNLLKDEKCLVILDDIWSIQAWDSINPAFPTRETSSKILLTSRNMEIAAHADRRGYLHGMECLKEEDSWELFQNVVFPERNTPDGGERVQKAQDIPLLDRQKQREILAEVPTVLGEDYKVDSKREKLGRGMVERCGGLPLAIIVLGGVLATKNSLHEWQLVSKNVKSYLEIDKGQGIENVLALSYNDLPPYLRPCFLYLSHFPEDFEIPVDLLIQLWIAEGFVFSKDDERNEGEIMEDVAERYLIELVERHMIQVEEREATLRIKTCRMHDVMRDLCLLKAKQENLVNVIDHSNSSISRTARRIVSHGLAPVQGIRGFHLRSIVFFCDPEDDGHAAFLHQKLLEYSENHKFGSINPLPLVLGVYLLCMLCKVHRLWRHMLNDFKLLRVLACDEFVLFKLPSAIGNLIHLRFLSLREFEFIWPKLPSSLGNLRCLQTLDLRVSTDDGHIYVPNVIWKLKQLRHLYLPKKCSHKTKLKLHTLTNLQTLVYFNTKNCSIADLSDMINLRKLVMFIEDLKEDLGKKPPIVKSRYIRSLSIESDGTIDTRNMALLLSSCLGTICELNLDAKIGKLPEYHHFFSNMAYIHLRRCELEDDPMPTLEKLPNLRILNLGSHFFNGKKMVCSAKCFPKLDSLSVFLLGNLEEWKVDEGAMPALRHLEIKLCTKLKILPDGLKFITTLQDLKIEYMPNSFKDKLVEGGEDFYKVQHVPSIIFQHCR